MSKPYQEITSASKIINLMNEPVVIVDWGFGKNQELKNNYVVFECVDYSVELNDVTEKPDVFYIVSPDTAKALALFTDRNDIIFPDGECRDKQNSLLGYYSLASCSVIEEPRATYTELED
jgi:GR25 family glycosyltransferase involved in LPS biosynthesis